MSVVPTFWLGSLEKHERLRTLVACERQAGRTGERMLLLRRSAHRSACAHGMIRSLLCVARKPHLG